MRAKSPLASALLALLAYALSWSDVALRSLDERACALRSSPVDTARKTQFRLDDVVDEVVRNVVIVSRSRIGRTSWPPWNADDHRVASHSGAFEGDAHEPSLMLAELSGKPGHGERPFPSHHG